MNACLIFRTLVDRLTLATTWLGNWERRSQFLWTFGLCSFSAWRRTRFAVDTRNKNSENGVLGIGTARPGTRSNPYGNPFKQQLSYVILWSLTTHYQLTALTALTRSRFLSMQWWFVAAVRQRYDSFRDYPIFVVTFCQILPLFICRKQSIQFHPLPFCQTRSLRHKSFPYETVVFAVRTTLIFPSVPCFFL